MKRLWLFIAEITGAAEHIRKSERKSLALEISGASYWFSSRDRYGFGYPFLIELAKDIDEGYYISGDRLRSRYDKFESNPEEVEKYFK